MSKARTRLVSRPGLWIALTLFGLGVVLFLPLWGLVFITAAGLPLVLTALRRRFLHLLPFWAFLLLPVAFGRPDHALQVALRSLDSLILVGGVFHLLGEPGLYRLLLRLPAPLGFVLLLSLKHFRAFWGTLHRHAMALRLRAPRHTPSLWGGALVVLFRKAEGRGERIAHAAKLRRLPWSW